VIAPYKTIRRIPPVFSTFRPTCRSAANQTHCLGSHGVMSNQAFTATTVTTHRLFFLSARKYCDHASLLVRWLIGSFVMLVVNYRKHKLQDQFSRNLATMFSTSVSVPNVTVSLLTFKWSRSKFKVKTAAMKTSSCNSSALLSDMHTKMCYSTGYQK